MKRPESRDNGKDQLALAAKVDEAGQVVPKESIFEFSTESHDDPNEGLVFGDAPVHCACPHCERSVITFIDHETSVVTWLLAFVVWFSLGWMAFWVLPLLWPAFKDVVHHCPRCLNVIARKSRISLPTFKTEVMSVKIGGCAVVLARKYVMISLALLFFIVTAYVMRQTVHLNPPQEMEKGLASLLTWEDFLFECGPRTSLQHRATTSRSFDDKFRKRTFTWQGEVKTIREGFDVWLLRTKSVVMVRMYPQRFPRRDLPDVALLFGESLNPEVGDLNIGDWVQFEATMAAHGHRGDPEVMMLWHIRTVERPSPLSSSAVSVKALHNEPLGEMRPAGLGLDEKRVPATKPNEQQSAGSAGVSLNGAAPATSTVAEAVATEKPRSETAAPEAKPAALEATTAAPAAKPAAPEATTAAALEATTPAAAAADGSTTPAPEAPKAEAAPTAVPQAPDGEKAEAATTAAPQLSDGEQAATTQPVAVTA